MTARAVTAAGTVAAVTAGALIVARGAQHGPAPQIRTDAYVVTRVERALASPGVSNDVSFARTVYQPRVTLEPAAPDEMILMSGPSTNSPWSVRSTVRWTYHRTARFSGFTSVGRPVFDWQTTGSGAPGFTAVNYRSKTWWRASLSAMPRLVKPATGHGGQNGADQPASVRCARNALIAGPDTGWPTRIRDGLKCGAYMLDGRQRIDGINAVKLSMLGGAGTLWVDPATYLPVRDAIDLGGVQEQTDFRWLPPTRANLAQLQVKIPAGFTRVPPPRG